MTWTTEQRITTLRNVVFLMIQHGNELSRVNGEHLSNTYGIPFNPKKLEKLWNEQLDRYEREQLTKLPPAPVADEISGEGK